MTSIVVTITGLLVAFLIDRSAAHRRPLSGAPLAVALGAALIAPMGIAGIAAVAGPGGVQRFVAFAVAQTLLGYAFVAASWGVRAVVGALPPA